MIGRIKFSDNRTKDKTMNSLFILIFLCCLQKITVFSVGGISFKLFHAATVVVLAPVFMNKRINFPGRVMNLLYAYLAFNTILTAATWGFSGLAFNYIFGYFLMMIICTLGTGLTLEDWLMILRKVAAVTLILVIVNAALNYRAIILYMNSPWMGHPVFSTIFGGGVNLEATWVAIFGFVFYKNKMKWPYIVTSTLISALYASRTGLIINVLCVLWYVVPLLNPRNIFKFVGTIILMIIIIAILMRYGLLDSILERFQDLGEDNGSMGRLAMWRHVGKAISKYPFGCGLGNCIEALTKATNLKFNDNNLHNLYMQNFVELGWLGGGLYIVIVLGFVLKEVRNIFKNPFVAMLFIYVLVSLLQFRGGEPITFVIVGIYTSNYRATHRTNLKMYRGKKI